MTPIHPSQSAKSKIDPSLCKHPQVEIVSRDEDSEYVECKECGEVFESSEFRDMEIEKTKLQDEE
jgi:transcription initiation factor TFIIIB Brf1 subunit/transcription initiation factor TFIIB